MITVHNRTPQDTCGTSTHGGVGQDREESSDGLKRRETQELHQMLIPKERRAPPQWNPGQVNLETTNRYKSGRAPQTVVSR